MAGPLTVCAVLAPRWFVRELAGIRDCKHLLPERRIEWIKRMQRPLAEGIIRRVVRHVSAHVIDAKGMAFAARLAVSRALARLEVSPRDVHVILDGALYAPGEFTQETIIGGDETEPLISLASIFAKVRRDTLMVRASRRFPGYGFEIHKGYGTEAHCAVLRREGPSPFHRFSFLSRIVSIG